MAKRITVLACVVAVGLLAATDVQAQAGSSGRAKLSPFGQSGIKATIVFVDDGTTLWILGTARGMDPADSYVSLIYDNGSLPGGPIACEPTIFDPGDPDFLLPTMFVGDWIVNPDGSGVLIATNTNGGASYVPLNRFRTISIRAESLGFEVVACGAQAGWKP